jgi:TrkA domain protein
VTEVTETQLPGVGVRYEFTTEGGDSIGILRHHTGRRDVILYDRHDPDRAYSTVELTSDETHTFTDLLGATHMTEALGAIQQRIEGLVLEWMDIEEGSPLAHRSIGESELRKRTAASVVAVIRGSTSVPAPGPEEILQPADVIVVVGTDEALASVRTLLRG